LSTPTSTPAALAAALSAVAPRAPSVLAAAPVNAFPQIPIPPSLVAIDLPADQYRHTGAPTEWWWHIGTLRAGDRTFGFEINAASFEGNLGIGFTQIMLTDVANKAHYQRTTPFAPPLMFNSLWAEHDPVRDWYAQLGTVDNVLSAIALTSPGSGYEPAPKPAPAVTIEGGGGAGALAAAVVAADGSIAQVVLLSPGAGYTATPTVTIAPPASGNDATAQAIHTYVTMSAPWGQTLSNMSVKALLNDQKTGTPVKFDLKLSQLGPPFYVWGTGVAPSGKPGPHLEVNNYYYSLTRLRAQGTITLGDEVFDVTGVTWMDHEYGAFGSGAGPKWILQDMQLDNGVCISNSVSLAPGVDFALNQATPSHATVQFADGTTYIVDSTITPRGDTWTSCDSGRMYYLTLLVTIPQFDACLTVTSLVDAQEFPVPGNPVYEGVASASGTFQGYAVSGTAWNEQALS
jgi:predicted secreted hydrolase